MKQAGRMRRLTGAVGAAVATASLLAGCSISHSRSSGVTATAAYVLHPTGGRSVGYLDIRNNGAADRLVSVSTSVGGTVQLRGPVRFGMTPVVMHTVGSIPIPANYTTQLVPNSYHLLITGAGPMHDGKDITLKLTFAHAGTLTILALVTNPATGGSSYFLN